jgi:hypothetical protein
MFLLAEVVGTEMIDPVWDFYAKNLRAGLFTGFLTISSFLLTSTTFVLINLKTHYYDKDFYKTRFGRRAATGSKRLFYQPLQNLGTALILAIGLSLTASLSQFTIGLHPAQWTVFVCGGLAGVAFLALLFCLWQVFQNLRCLFQCWNDEKMKPPAATPSTH